MSRIYSNDPLTALPVKNIFYDQVWNESDWHQGSGVILEASVKSRLRFSLIDKNQQKIRYCAFVLLVRRAHRRVFDGKKEIEPNFSATEKVRTGFLHSSYKVVPKGQSDFLTYDELVKIIQPTNVLTVFGLDTNEKDSFINVFLEENDLEKLEISDKDEIRLKTKGNSPFLENLCKINALNSALSNYAGDDKIGASWTDKIMAVKQNLELQEEEPNDEWDD
ncbi:hypothetical protein HELRODRAFT_177326 [Helobdella robusta]|uniref:Arpin n=1 Tax=Helobdella robusta TaxID=6412 RepID=T1FBI1_HELRO|nr:hypothetical protein HELRODRAFT_177326 [Helobdella robusta]ESN98089.1 hypothetical protein HELRODRAFT_177326 [Helobdella robusta]